METKSCCPWLTEEDNTFVTSTLHLYANEVKHGIYTHTMCGRPTTGVTPNPKGTHTLGAATCLLCKVMHKKDPSRLA